MFLTGCISIVFLLTEAGSQHSRSESREPSWTPSVCGHVSSLTAASKRQKEGDRTLQCCSYVGPEKGLLVVSKTDAVMKLLVYKIYEDFTSVTI